MKTGQQRKMTAVVAAGTSCGGSGSGGDVLVSWAEKLSGRAGKRARGVLRFAFYGRVSTEDWQDPVTSRARQLQQAMMLVAGVGVIVAEFFDTGESRTLPWRGACRPLLWWCSSRIRSGGGTRS
jgi:site-specific DNA recombinase